MFKNKILSVLIGCAITVGTAGATALEDQIPDLSSFYQGVAQELFPIDDDDDFKVDVDGIIKRAQAGDNRSRYVMASMYCQGRGVEVDAKKATEILVDLASQNYAPAVMLLADSIYDGEYSECKLDFGNSDTADILYKYTLQAAELTEYDSFIARLAEGWFNGTFGKVDYAKAYKYYMKLAKQGGNEALFYLAVMYDFGLGRERDVATAMVYYQRYIDSLNASPWFVSYRMAEIYESEPGFKNERQYDIQMIKAKTAFSTYYDRDFVRLLKIDPEKAEKKLSSYFKNSDYSEYSMEEKNSLCDAFFLKDRGVKPDYDVAFGLCSEAAKAGYHNAQNQLAIMYDNGTGVKQDKEQAIKWYKKSSENGNRFAAYNLGLLYYNRGNYQEAAEYFKISGDKDRQGDGYYRLALMYAEGKLGKEDYQTAYKYYQQSAELGNAVALNNIGVIFYNGSLGQKDCRQAIYNYQRSASGGCEIAMYNLSKIYQYGYCGEQINYNLSYNYARRAADKGYSSAYDIVGKSLLLGQGTEQNIQDGAKWLEKAADAGSDYAMYVLGYYYVKGEFLERDLDRGMAWLKKASDMNSSNADQLLGNLHCVNNFLGAGVPTNLEQCKKYLLKAGKEGLADAYNDLGLHFMNGVFGKDKVMEAEPLFKKAADSGSQFAAMNLGTLYLDNGYTDKGLEQLKKCAENDNPNCVTELGIRYAHGNGVPKDEILGRKYYEKGMALGAGTSANNLGYMYHLGLGGEQNYEMAMKYYIKAVELGEVVGYDGICELNILSLGAGTSPANGHFACKKAYEAGIPEGIYYYAQFFMHDDWGETKNLARAEQLLKQSLNEGYADAAQKLEELKNMK